MLKNYFTIAINNLLKNKLYSAVNIIGLAIGLAACIVIALYVKDQYSYDKQWKNSGRIYRVNFSVGQNGKAITKLAFTPFPAMPELQKYFQDEIEKSTRTFSNTIVIDTGTSQFKDKLVQVDPAFIDMFQFDVLAGSLGNTLTSPTNIALSTEAASRYFGIQDPIGKTITAKIYGTTIDYIVTAVYRIPGNTILEIPLLSMLEDTYMPSFIKYWWHSYNTCAYFELKDGIDVESLKPLTSAFIDKYVDISQFMPDSDLKASDVTFIDFQNIEKAHLDSPWDQDRNSGNKTVVISFAVISLLILLIGCINFTVLTTAKATQRAREVAMKKVVGAKRKQLIIQFLGESTFIVLLSMILSMGVVEVMLPIFESIVGKTFSINYTSPSFFVPLLVLLAITGISGGLYPAFILSGFRPGDTLKANRSKETKGSVSLRNGLVIFQFRASIILIVSTCVMFVQMRYSINRDPGYNKDNLLVISQMDLYPDLRNKLEPLKQELLNLTSISSVGFSDIHPSQKYTNCFIYTRADQPETSYSIPRTGVDYDFFKTYQIPVIAGRNYTAGHDIPEPIVDIMDTDIGKLPAESAVRNIIINESSVKKLGFINAEDAVGKTLKTTTFGNTNYIIIGVVADNHLFSINSPPRAEVYMLDPVQIDDAIIRFTGSPEKVSGQVKSVWNKIMGDVDISTIFVDQLIAREFQQEQTEQKIFISFSILAIIIACLGLFGAASFTVERRTREIGLRKVMGARVKNIVSLLLWQFSKPVLIANIIAWPVAIFTMQKWLERFTYRFNPLLMIPICLVSGLIALAIAWFTVAGNTSRMAKSKPIKALRYE
ncbi:MAG: ABC transporter permease [Desulfobacteraceae bacterium]|jgi:putative ABC transport system permease protein